jgi:virginiamycin B lyase
MKRTRSRSSLPAIAALALAGCAASSAGTSSIPAYSGAAIRHAATPALRVYTAGKSPGFPKGSVPYDITLGPDGAMWFTDGNVPGVGRIDSHGTIVEYTKGLQAGALPYSIVSGADGNLWFSDARGAIGTIATSGKMSELSVLGVTNGGVPLGIAAAPDGTIWAVVLGPPSILVRLDRNGKLSVVPIPKTYQADGSLAADATGALWMMVRRGEDGVMLERKAHGGWLAHATGLTDARLPCCPNQAPKRIAFDRQGNTWFSTLYWIDAKVPGNLAGEVTTSGTQLFRMKSRGISSAYPSGIAASGTNVWLTGDSPFQIAGGLWRVGEKGAQWVYPVANNPIDLAADGSGNLWFTAEAFDKPGQIVEAVTPQ